MSSSGSRTPIVDARATAAEAGTGVPARPAVAILEVEPLGHRLEYLRHLVDAAGPGGSLVLTTATAAGSAEYAEHAAGAGIAPVVLPEGDGSRAAILRSALRRAVSAGVRTLVVPDGDLYVRPLLELLVRGPRPPLEIRLLLMRTTEIGGPERLRPATLVKPALVAALRRFPRVTVLFLTDAFGVVRRRRGFPGVRPVRDPVPARHDRVVDVHPDRPSWFPPVAADVTLVGVFGVIEARKNLPVLLAALATAPQAQVVVAGRIEPDAQAQLATAEARELIASGRVVVREGLLPTEEFGAALANVDVAAALYDNDAPSGILAQSCARGTPVLVPEGGWLAKVVAATGIGVAVPLTPSGVAEGLTRAMRDRTQLVEATGRSTALLGTSQFTRGLLGR